MVYSANEENSSRETGTHSGAFSSKNKFFILNTMMIFALLSAAYYMVMVKNVRLIGDIDMIKDHGKVSINNSNETNVEKEQSPLSDPDAQKRISHFKETAKSFTPTTDKIGDKYNPHNYHNMYGTFLLPFAAAKPTFKFLEIGMGCDMHYGPGASINLWKTLFPQADLWEAEYDGACVKNVLENGGLDGINPLVGDQSNFTVLDSWIKDSGGKFDVIIDDGGHTNCQISNTFEKLWPELNAGGLYFIEDIHVGYIDIYNDGSICGDVVMGEKMRDWQQQLIFPRPEFLLKENQVIRHPLPKDVIFVHCQAEACVLGKRHSNVNDPHVPE